MDTKSTIIRRRNCPRNRSDARRDAAGRCATVQAGAARPPGRREEPDNKAKLSDHAGRPTARRLVPFVGGGGTKRATIAGRVAWSSLHDGRDRHGLQSPLGGGGGLARHGRRSSYCILSVCNISSVQLVLRPFLSCTFSAKYIHCSRPVSRRKVGVSAADSPATETQPEKVA